MENLHHILVTFLKKQFKVERVYAEGRDHHGGESLRQVAEDAASHFNQPGSRHRRKHEEARNLQVCPPEAHFLQLVPLPKVPTGPPKTAQPSTVWAFIDANLQEIFTFK